MTAPGSVLVSVHGRTVGLERPDARIVASTLSLSDGEAGPVLGFRLRRHLRAAEAGSFEVADEPDENVLLLALGAVERDGFMTPALERLRLAAHGQSPPVE